MVPPKSITPAGNLSGNSSSSEFAHLPVLCDQLVSRLAKTSPRRIVDCTVGGAGHSSALLAALPDAELLALDRDPRAAEVATERLQSFGSRAVVYNRPFSRLAAALAERGWDRVDAIIADLGVSSEQLDRPGRGFSFRFDGPLDMRMDTGGGGDTLAERLALVTESELERVIRDFGEERRARAVARAIIAEQPQTTAALADVVRSRVRKSKDRIDPATRTFQALRIWTNDELGELRSLLAASLAALNDGGMLVLISFHSLEDRVVKAFIRDAERGCVCPPAMPVCGCGKVAQLQACPKKAVVADPVEVAANPRARSARLRLARRCGEVPS